MPTPERPKPGKRSSPPQQTRTSLASAMGGLPLPPRLAKPPAPRVLKPAPASSVAGFQSVAGRLGRFLPTPGKVARPPKGGGPKGGGPKRRG